MMNRQSDKPVVPAASESLAAPHRSTTVVSVLMLTAVTLLCLAPFANKAFHIDDPLFLWSARQIQAHPKDPFGITVNWYGSEMPLSEVTKNPPGACYYIALMAYAVGWSEVVLHLAFLLPGVMAVLGTYFLAWRFCTKPAMAAVATLLTPVFWVSSTTIMCDTMMLAWWVWATVLWVRGMEKREPFSLALAAFLISVAAMTKYFGVTLMPLLLAYSIVRERRLGWWAAYLLIPVALLVGCDWVARSLYGHGLLFDAGSYALEAHSRTGLTVRGLTTIVFTGGCVATVLFYAPLLWSRKGLFLGALVTVLVAVVLLAMKTLGSFPLYSDGQVRWLALLELAVFAGGGGRDWQQVQGRAGRPLVPGPLGVSVLYESPWRQGD
jgi:4-amino-4-deoxy-L-arabinose transferase-like glycosyltransferase